MTNALLCVLLRIAAPQSAAVMEFAANDPALRSRVHLSPAAAHYLRTETWAPAHPKAAPECKSVRRSQKCQVPKRPATKHRRSKR